MPSRGIATTYISSIRTYGWLVTIIMGIGIVGFIGGFGAIRYSDQENDPYHKWVYYRYTTVITDGIFMTIFFWIYIFDVSVANGKVRGFLFWVMLISAVYATVCVIWDVVIWAGDKCNEELSPGPPPVFKYAHCVNRDFPTVKYPDSAFFCTLFGMGFFAAGMYVAAYVINQISCETLAMRAVRGNNLATPVAGPNTAYLSVADDDGGQLYDQAYNGTMIGDELDYGRGGFTFDVEGMTKTD